MCAYYAVANGRNPGVYENWKECQRQIIGFKGAKYKKFLEYEDAVKFVDTPTIKFTEEEKNFPVVYIDGSFNKKTNVIGYGGYISYKGEDGTTIKSIIKGSSNEEKYTKYNNVAGEVLGSIKAISECIDIGFKDIILYYDYQGIESWATGDWQCKNDLTKYYKEFYDSIKSKINVKFVKVDGHTGIAGNEEADKLAKEAVGIKIN